MERYLAAVGAALEGVSRADRRRAMEALAAQLDELQEAGIDPREALGSPESYAAALSEALTGDASRDDPHLRVLGIPIESRGPLSADVRSRTWNPESPRIVVPRLLGAGWTLNLGALAVRLRMIRPDDASGDVMDRVPERAVRAAQLGPLTLAAVAAGMLSLAWRTLPARVATGFGATGRATQVASKTRLIGVLLLGAVPALWALQRRATVEDRLVRAANATMLATVSVSVVAASVLSARRPRGRWGLLVAAAFPLGTAASLAAIVLPLRSGLRRSWRSAAAHEPATAHSEGPGAPGDA